MHRIVRILPLVALLAIALPTGAGAQVAATGRINDAEAERSIERLERAADAFRRSLDEALDRSGLDNSKREDRINRFVREFEVATDNLRKRFDGDTPAEADAADVLERAARIDRFMSRNALTDRAQADWRALRESLDQVALAYGVTWSWDGVAVTRRASDKDVKGLLTSLERHADSFRTSLRDALDDSSFDDRRAEDEINGYVRAFEQATDRWKSRFDDDNTAAADATEVLRRAASIDAFMRAHRMTPRAQADWSALRGSLDELARAYNVTWTW